MSTTELHNAVVRLLDSADDTGCTDDLIVVTKTALRDVADQVCDTLPEWLQAQAPWFVVDGEHPETDSLQGVDEDKPHETVPPYWVLDVNRQTYVAGPFDTYRLAVLSRTHHVLPLLRGIAAQSKDK